MAKMEAAATWEPIDSLTPWDRNPRRNDGAVESVAHSITRFGFGAPIIARASDRVIIGGHTRYKAAQKLGLDKVPVRFLDLDPAEAAALALADNKLGELAEWDDAGVAAILAELEAQGAPIDGLGWNDEELKALLGDGLEAAPPSDDAPELDEQGEPDSQPGAVYQLGPHRLVCGDSTKAETWDALMVSDKAQMVWTDPPYGVAYVGGTRDPRDNKNYKSGLRIENDDLDADDLSELLKQSLSNALSACIHGAVWYVSAPANPPNIVFGRVLLDLGIWRRSLIWLKDQFVFGRGDYHYRHEPIFYGWTPGAAHYFCDDHTLDSIIEIPNPKGAGKKGEHPTMKPIELVAYCIRNSSKSGWIVADPFGGSGTTLMACAAEGRIARLIELDPRYCDVIRKRWTRYADENGLDAGPGALRGEVRDVE